MTEGHTTVLPWAGCLLSTRNTLAYCIHTKVYGLTRIEKTIVGLVKRKCYRYGNWTKMSVVSVSKSQDANALFENR